MKLASDDGTILELRAVGYEFPHHHSALHDSDWLDIDLRLTRPTATWHYTDPALLTYELREIATWLLLVVRGRTPKRLWFTEPELSLELIATPHNRMVVRVYLSDGFRPPWASVDPDVDFFLTFPVRRLPFLLASASLRLALTRFPQRARV